VIHTYTTWNSMQPIVERIPEAENESFRMITSTIGAMMVWPANQVDRKWTINGARGCIRSIDDRFDLTVECVRRHYLGMSSPLEDTFSRYRDFFALFVDFRGFINFFLLQDIVTEDCSSVTFFMPFGDFKQPAAPGDMLAYVSYRRQSIEFVHGRNERISRLHAVRDADKPSESPAGQPYD
jgi:Family of unknown function (DUF6994)